MKHAKIRFSDLFVSACFLAFLFTAMLVTVWKEKADYSFFENRDLAKLPEYTAQADKDGSYVKELEKYLADHAALRNTLLKVKTRVDLSLGRPVVNDTIISEGHFLPFMGYNQLDRDEAAGQAEKMADNLAQIRDTVASYGGYYCFAAIPNQQIYWTDMYPDYLDSSAAKGNLNVELLSAALERRGVDFLDIGAEVEAMGHPEGFMSKVDHHYTMDGAFISYHMLMDKLREATGWDLPVLEKEDAIIQTLPNPYLGSRARKLLGLVPGEERAQVIWPREPVPFTRSNNDVEQPSSVYALPENDWGPVMYSSLYMGGDIARTTIDTGREELPSILLYGDSFTNAMECVLYLSFDKMYSVDLRHCPEDFDFIAYINQIRPDIVVCLRDYNTLLDLSGNGAGENR